MGGSTNAVIHLTALAGRLGIKLNLSMFDSQSKEIPVIANLKPSGKYLMEDFYYAGGIGALINELSDFLNLECKTVTGASLGENTSNAECFNKDVIRSVNNPIYDEGGVAVLRGSLAPDGAIIKHSAASKDLLDHVGRAVVFENPTDLKNRIDDEKLDVTPDDILVLKNAGPIGGPGMPEAGYLPLPKKLLKSGVRDMIRISDARMSGTAFGTIVLHVSPESAVGGPLALVKNGDLIKLDVSNRTLDLLLDESEVEIRRKRWKQPTSPEYFDRGYGKIYVEHIQQAPEGCDFDFLNGYTSVETHIDVDHGSAGHHTG